MLAIQVLGGIPDPAVLEVLIPLLGSKDADVRAEAAFAIEDVLRERLVAVLPILVEAMDSKSWRVRLGVVEILGSPVFPSVPEPGITKMRYGALIDALDDGKKEVAEAALAILEKRTRLDFGDDTKKWREWYEDGMPVAKCCFPM